MRTSYSGELGMPDERKPKRLHSNDTENGGTAGPHPKYLKQNGSAAKGGKSLLTQTQLDLDLTIAKEVEIDGIGMGVLSDGTPYLTGRGLARMCGIDQKVIVEMTSHWDDTRLRPREIKIKEVLNKQGFSASKPYVAIDAAGTVNHAFPDIVCMAVLEYYAFDAGVHTKEHALKNYRLLARRSFRDFIYTQVGYDPRQLIPEVWRQFHDRVSLVYDAVPAGYFSVFKEIADIVVTLINGGAIIGSEFAPDISVGQHWAKYWCDNGFASVYGDRQQYTHNYPQYFPQSASNPQYPYCYPDSALGEFRRWMREVYLPEKFPGYLKSKEKQGALPASFSEIAVAAFGATGNSKRLLSARR
jgi:hypothetical protein